MTAKVNKPSQRTGRNLSPMPHDAQPLLRALVAEAIRRGDTLAALAKALGVSYERLATWRRGDADIRSARPSVHQNAARYLGVPTVLILVMAGTISLEQFIWPQKGAMGERMARELERLRQHPFIGLFVPAELASAAPPVKLFVAFLFHELSGDAPGREPSYRWMSLLHQASVGNAEAQSELQTLRISGDPAGSLF
nr:hypothetical protein [uncultured Albidiferax sp.]